MQRQALPGIFVRQGQPLERSSATGTIGNEVITPHVVLEPRRLVHAAAGTAAGFGPQLVDRPAADRAAQAQLAPQPVDALEVYGPPRPLEQGVDAPIAPAQVLARQPADGADQRLVVATILGRVAQRGAGPAQHRGGAALRHLVLLAEVLGGGTLLGGGHHFF
jgi:hypothetical protein